MTTYPYGYGTGRLTLEQMRDRYGTEADIPCHPAFWAAFEAAMIHLDGKLGIGGGYRFTQPVKPGFAPPGKSFHERQNYASGFSGYAAFDTVWTVPGGRHRAPSWSDIEAVKEFGLHAFISGEPWHVQARNMRGYTSWLNAGRPDPNPGLVIAPPPPPPPDFPPNTDYSPTDDWWLFPLDTGKPTVRVGSEDNGYPGHVRYLQDVIYFYAGGNIARDGQFGPQTQGRVMDVQRIFALTIDGVCGPKTWAAIDGLTNYITAPPGSPQEPDTPPDVPVAPDAWSESPCLYYVQDGDSPWRVGERVYGSGTGGADLLPAELFNKPGVHIQIPNIKGRGTKVAKNEGPWAIVERLGYPNPAEALDVFYDWNGGQHRTLHAGDPVFMPSLL